MLTSPVVIVMLRIHRSCRASSTGSPCTPTFATCPPGLTSSVHIVNVSGMPTHSMATSTPSPSVTARTWSFQSVAEASTVSVAPSCFATSRRFWSRSTTMTWAAPYSPAVATAASPTGPAPTTATVSPGWTCP